MLYKTGSLADFFHNSRKALVNARDDKDEGDSQKNEKKFEKSIDNLISMQYI